MTEMSEAQNLITSRRWIGTGSWTVSKNQIQQLHNLGLRGKPVAYLGITMTRLALYRTVSMWILIGPDQVQVAQ